MSAGAIRSWLGEAARLFALLLVCVLALQLYFLARVVAMAVVDPLSTSFQRSEIRRLVVEPGPLVWQQRWVAYERIATPLKRAVIAAEDAGFVDHHGVEWGAVEKAWDRNRTAEERSARLSERVAERVAGRMADRLRSGPERRSTAAGGRTREPKLVGGSTITQQLAKNLFLSGERTLLRKGQEFVITQMLEAVLSKRRILEIYLNNVEWGEGVFGAEAAARHYLRSSAETLASGPSARLAVMLPAPKRFEQRPNSAYIGARASSIAARMGAVDLP